MLDRKNENEILKKIEAMLDKNFGYLDPGKANPPKEPVKLAARKEKTPFKPKEYTVLPEGHQSFMAKKAYETALNIKQEGNPPENPSERLQWINQQQQYQKAIKEKETFDKNKEENQKNEENNKKKEEDYNSQWKDYYERYEIQVQEYNQKKQEYDNYYERLAKTEHNDIPKDFWVNLLTDFYKLEEKDKQQCLTMLGSYLCPLENKVTRAITYETVMVARAPRGLHEDHEYKEVAVYYSIPENEKYNQELAKGYNPARKNMVQYLLNLEYAHDCLLAMSNQTTFNDKNTDLEKDNISKLIFYIRSIDSSFNISIITGETSENTALDYAIKKHRNPDNRPSLVRFFSDRGPTNSAEKIKLIEKYFKAFSRFYLDNYTTVNIEGLKAAISAEIQKLMPIFQVDAKLLGLKNALESVQDLESMKEIIMNTERFPMLKISENQCYPSKIQCLALALKKVTDSLERLSPAPTR